MANRVKVRIALLLIAAEACCYGMTYALAAAAMDFAPQVSTLSFVLAAVFLPPATRIWRRGVFAI